MGKSKRTARYSSGKKFFDSQANGGGVVSEWFVEDIIKPLYKNFGSEVSPHFSKHLLADPEIKRYANELYMKVCKAGALISSTDLEARKFSFENRKAKDALKVWMAHALEKGVTDQEIRDIFEECATEELLNR